MTGTFRLPISLRMTLWYGASMLVLLGLFGVLLVTSMHWNQHVVLHQRLFKTQSELMPTVAVEDGRPVLVPPLDEWSGSLKLSGPFGTYVRLLSPEGQVWEQSANFAGAAPLAPAFPDRSKMAEVERTWDGMLFRSFYVPITTENAVLGWLEVSGMAWNFRHQLVGWPVGAAILVTVLLALAGGYVLARRALRPVVRLTAAAHTITASDLSVRLPLDTSFQDELTDLAETFNTMIARLEAAFERERRFTADAAHELLNPLATVRNEVEVALRRDRDAPAYREALQTVRAEVERLGQMLEHLLRLARVDADGGAQRTTVDLAAVCREAVAAWTAPAARRQVTLCADLAPSVLVAANAWHLGVVVENLLDNAVKYTPAGGRVTVRAALEDADAVLSVIDTGVGFDAVTGTHLFDRFFRGDAPPVQDQAGSGLGLALVQAVVHAYDGTVEAHSEGRNQGSTFTVRLPYAASGGREAESDSNQPPLARL